MDYWRHTHPTTPNAVSRRDASPLCHHYYASVSTTKGTWHGHGMAIDMDYHGSSSAPFTILVLLFPHPPTKLHVPPAEECSDSPSPHSKPVERLREDVALPLVHTIPSSMILNRAHTPTAHSRHCDTPRARLSGLPTGNSVATGRILQSVGT